MPDNSEAGLTAAAESKVPIDVDSSDAPSFLRITISGEWPSVDAQRVVRDELLSGGRLTPASKVLVDLRGVTGALETANFAGLKDGPVARVQAYLVASATQQQMARRFKQAAKGTLVEIFTDEKDALEWLWNAEADY